MLLSGKNTIEKVLNYKIDFENHKLETQLKVKVLAFYWKKNNIQKKPKY